MRCRNCGKFHRRIECPECGRMVVMMPPMHYKNGVLQSVYNLLHASKTKLVRDALVKAKA